MNTSPGLTFKRLRIDLPLQREEDKMSAPCKPHHILWLALITCLVSTSCADEPTQDPPIIFVIADMDDSKDQSSSSPEMGDADMSSGPEDMAIDQGPMIPGCDLVGFETTQVAGERKSSSLSVKMTRGTGAKVDELSVLMYGDATADGVYELKDESFKECAACVLIQTGCEQGQCDATYMATQGRLKLTTTEGTANVVLEEIKLAQVRIEDDLSSTKLVGGATYCMPGPTSYSGPLSSDPCAEATDPSIADVSCGPAPLTVNFTAPSGGLDPVYSIFWDFGDGETASRQEKIAHTFAKGEWMVEVEVRGRVANADATITSPQKIIAY